jgi:dipeptidyl aminopeptidase/acylaminoacyl peptidase
MRRAIAAMCVLLLSCISTRAAEPTLQAFAELPLMETPQISPDGTRYAALLSGGGRQMLAVMAFAGGTPVSVEMTDSIELRHWQWVNDEWLIMTIAVTRPVAGAPWRVTRVYGVRAKDAKIFSLARDEDAQSSAVLWIAKDGTPRILLGVQQALDPDEEKYYTEVFEVNVTNGKRISRVRPRTGVMDWYADADGTVRLGIGYRDLSRRIQVWYREKAGDVLHTIDSASVRKGEELNPIPALFLADPGKALAFSDHTGFNALYRLDLETQTLGEEVFSVPGYDIGALVTDPTGKELLGVKYSDTRPRMQWLDPVMSKAQRDLDSAVGPNRHAHIVSMSRDQRRLMVQASSASDPGSFYLMDLDKSSLREVARIRPRLSGAQLGAVRSLRYKARDGLEIEAVLTLPPGREARALPLIVMPHGGPQSRDEETFDYWSQYLATQGYAVIQPNFRGSTGYGNEFYARGDGQWGLAMQDDLLDAIDHLAAEGIADVNRVCVVGGSYGGYAAMRAAQRDGGRYRCAASFAGVSDLVASLQEDDSLLEGFRRDDLKRKAPDPKAVSPINGVEQIAIPLLLVHGKKDMTVSYTQSATMAAKLAKAGKSVRHVELPEADHHLSRSADRLTFLQELTAFLKQHNPPDSAPGRTN